MPAKPKAENVFRIGAEFDADSVIDGMQKMGTDWGKRMRRIEKASRDSMKGSGKAIKQFMWQTGGARKAYKRLAEDQGKAFKEIRGEYTKSLREVREYAKAVADAKNNIEMAKGTSLFEGGSENMEKLNAELSEAQKKLEKAQAMSEKLGQKRNEAHEGVREIKEASSFDRESVVDAFSDAAGEFWGPFESLLRKDLPGAIEKGGKLAGHGWEKLFSMTGKVPRSLQKIFTKADTWKGIGKEMTGKMAGASLGGKAKALGGAAMGGAMKGMADVLKIVGKLGPLLASVSTIVVGLVQLFLDAEAAAKDFNNEIMSTAGNADFLAGSMGNATQAAEDMKKSLAGAYAQATDFSNLKWGLTKEQYTATSNALTAEGVSLKKLSKEYASTSGFVHNFGDMVKMSVGYSKAFGVSLQEVSQFEGEMMSELGMNIDQVEAGFQNMLKGAEESGIATNKFFGIIRGFSTDLTYFTTRMEDVTKAMMALGRAMSPRDAQKFLQSVTGYFKTKGAGELTVDVLMGGGAGKTGARLQKSMDDKLGSLAKDIAKQTGASQPMSVKEMRGVLKKSDAELAKWLNENQQGISDDTKKAVYEAAIQQGKLNKGGLVDIAAALQDADPWAAMEQMEAKVQGITGKKIEDLTNIERLAAESAAQVPLEMQKQFEKMRQGTEDMKAALINKLAKGVGLTDQQKIEKGLNLTKAETDAVNKLYDANDKRSAADQLRDKDAKSIWNAMSSDQQKALADGGKQMDFQEKTAGNTTSIMTRLQILVDWFMRTFYQTILGIWETISDILPWKTDAAKHAKDVIAAAKSGNMELANIAQSSETHEEYQKKANEYWSKIKTQGQKLDQTIADITTPAAAPAPAAAAPEVATPAPAAAAPEVAGNMGTFHNAPATGAATPGGPQVVTLSKETMAKLDLGGADQPPPMTMEEAAKATAQGQMKAVPSAENMANEAVTGHSIFTHDMTAEENQEDVMDMMSDHGSTLSDIWKALRVRGIKLDKPFLENNVKKVFTDATYSAASDALTDYYFLSKADSADVVKAIQNGANPSSIGKAMKGLVAGDPSKNVKPMSIDDAMKKVVSDAAATSKMGGGMPGMQLPGHADGGMVTAVAGGMATVRPAPGEGLASVGKGETIGKAGGGGGGAQVVELRLKGDIARIIDARAHNAINNHERMKTRR